MLKSHYWKATQNRARRWWQTESLFLKARWNTRRRANLPLGLRIKRGKKVFQMLNAILPDSYIRPHKQTDKHIIETLTCLKGGAYIVFFNSKGKIKDVISVNGKNEDKVTIGPGVYHTVVVEKPTLFYEEMGQPLGSLYDPLKDKISAPWSLDEDYKNPKVVTYRQWLLAECRRLVTLPRGKAIGLYGGSWWERFLSNFKFWEEPYEEVDQMLPKNGAIVELGCGEGLLTNYLAISSPKRKIIGYELVPERLKLAKKGITNTAYFVGDVTRVPFPHADAFILFHVLHHLPSKKVQGKVLKKVRDSLRPDGKLIIVDVHVAFTVKYLAAWIADHFLVPWVFEKRFFTRAYFRTEGEWKKILKNIGFKVETKYATKGRPFPNIIFECFI